MKTIFLAALMLTMCFALQAQQLKKFRVGLGGGYAVAISKVQSGRLFYIQPSYRLNDNLSIGTKWEVMIAPQEATYFTVNTNTFENSSYGGLNSFTVHGQYSFGTGKVRPFVGLGIGAYLVVSNGGGAASSGTYVYKDHIHGSNTLGIYPMAGLEIGHLHVAFELNLGPYYRQVFSYQDTDGNSFSSNNTMSASYLGIKAGYTFGGGLK
jgi:hypothetical protein